ncbi:MAG: enoyl-CoA hydratase/isomerase family protein [Deltaproteobacteria bacterium]|nr:enoyl-CoA hydratase/isomerase family protein [Deltaproteobacteria bacterium]MBW2385556.1 enoyl-CoA hydratase/isomerase family protein [Deltaproteobacteria bacterium]
MHYESLLYDVHDGVASITLDREKAANALDLQMAKDLMYAALTADEDPDVRVVVIGAKGKMFCAGGDLASFADAGDARPALLKEITTYLHAAISRFARMDAPVIASVGGTAAGAGMSLACAADLAVCGESAKFTMAYTRVGLTPDGSSTYYLPRLIGARRTLELMLTNRVLSAAEALEWGLVNQVVPNAELEAATAKLAASLVSGPTASYGATKKLVLTSLGESLESQMELESRGIADAARRHDGQEGIAAFLEKRKPDFKGR